MHVKGVSIAPLALSYPLLCAVISYNGVVAIVPCSRSSTRLSFIHYNSRCRRVLWEL